MAIPLKPSLLLATVSDSLGQFPATVPVVLVRSRSWVTWICKSRLRSSKWKGFQKNMFFGEEKGKWNKKQLITVPYSSVGEMKDVPNTSGFFKWNMFGPMEIEISEEI